MAWGPSQPSPALSPVVEASFCLVLVLHGAQSPLGINSASLERASARFGRALEHMPAQAPAHVILSISRL